MALRSSEHIGVTAYLNAGGRGTRLDSLFVPDPEYGVAKALLEVGDPPLKLIDHHIAKMAQAAFRNIVIGAGDLASVAQHVQRHYEANAAISSVAHSDRPQLGTAGDLVLAIRERPELFGDQVLVKNVDTILDIDDQQFIEFHRSLLSTLSIAVTKKKGVPNENAFLLNQQGRVIYSAEATINTRDRDTAAKLAVRQGSSTGALLIDTDFLRNVEWAPERGQLSLYRDIMGRALIEDAVGGYDNGEKFFVDVGTEKTWNTYARSEVLQQYLCYDTNTNQDEEVA